jgi:hypothetical protein
MRALLSVFLFCLALAPMAHAAPPKEPMVDGDCGEYKSLPATRLAIGSDGQLFIYDNEHYIWFCYLPGSPAITMLDLVLKTDRFPAGLNLHVSAQLGEWPAERPDLMPKDAESGLWWNNTGWTASTIPVTGIDRSGAVPRPKLRAGTARELQLAKALFGSGDWVFAMEVYQIGSAKRLRFPADGTFYRFAAMP